MDDLARKKALDELAKKLSITGEVDVKGLVNPKENFMNQALEARDATQSALAKKVLDNTGIPIPGKRAGEAKIHDFYNRILQEQYPEIKADVDLEDLTKHQAKGLYWSAPEKDMRWIEMQKDLWKKDPISAVGTLLHEGGHQYDDEVLGFRGSKPIMENMKNAGLSPDQTYEIMSTGHHKQNIPGLREGGSYGKGALLSLLKNGAFRAIAPVTQAVGAAADIKEGNPNTAAARMVSGLAPAGSEQLQDDLMEQARIEDHYPKLKDSTYLRTLKNIGERRIKAGKSPVVEGFDGEKVDTSATENSDFLNLLEAKKRQNSQG